MFTIFYSLAIAQLAFALPHDLPRRSTYSDTSYVLSEKLRKDWYTDVDKQADVNFTAKPSEFYSCAGPMMDDFPTKDDWLSFEQMWDINKAEIARVNSSNLTRGSRRQGELSPQNWSNFTFAANQTKATRSTAVDDIRDTIVDVSRKSYVDARLILALVMQESTGNINVICTGAVSSDCGLMQIRGSRRYSESTSKESIQHMIEDGIYGTPINNMVGAPKGWPGYLYYFDAPEKDLNWVNPDGFWRGNPYAAAHVYNAGEISSENLSVADAGISTNAYYANDVASRLMGWNGRRGGCLKSQKCKGFGFQNRECDMLLP